VGPNSTEIEPHLEQKQGQIEPLAYQRQAADKYYDKKDRGQPPQ